VRTITAGSSKLFTFVTTFGDKIAAARDDNTVGIYDSVTGVLRLSLKPASLIQAMSGSPGGSILFCAHKTPSITVWDMQTGGLIYTFVLERNAENIAVSLKGRYLACGFSDESVEVWEVTNKMEGAAVWTSSPVTHFCWLEPEEQLAVSAGPVVRIHDIVAGTTLWSFKKSPVRHMAYSQKFKQLAIIVNLSFDSAITFVDTQTGKVALSHWIHQNFSCSAFSQTTEELVCGAETRGLRVFNIPTRRWRHIDYQDPVTSVSPLSNGTAATYYAGSGVQLLSLDGGHTEPRQPALISALHLRSLDQGKVIAVLQTGRDSVVLLEAATMRRLFEIPALRSLATPTDRVPIFCASLGRYKAVYSFREREKEYMQLWEFHHHRDLPKWTVEIGGLPSFGEISPSGSRLVTFYDVDNQTCVCVWGVEGGQLEAQLRADPIHPLDITFNSENRFYSHHDTYRVPYDISHPDQRFPTAPSLERTTLRHLIVRHEPLPVIGGPRWGYDVDDTYEWVVSDSKRVCWIQPGYIGSVQPSYCWAKTSLVMAGQDGTLRKLTFENYVSSLTRVHPVFPSITTLSQFVSSARFRESPIGTTVQRKRGEAVV
jgi:WD40 repeat protein